MFMVIAPREVDGVGTRSDPTGSHSPRGTAKRTTVIRETERNGREPNSGRSVERVEGGFRLSGRWSFSSGCDHCEWVFLGGFVPVEPGEHPDMRTFLLPKRDYAIDDTWHTMALQGTGSKDVVVEGAFVPEHRTHRMSDGFRCSRESLLHTAVPAQAYAQSRCRDKSMWRTVAPAVPAPACAQSRCRDKSMWRAIAPRGTSASLRAKPLPRQKHVA